MAVKTPMQRRAEREAKEREEHEAPRATLTVVPITIGGGKQALKDAARSYTGEALGVVIAAMQSGELPVGQRIAAAQEILNRGWGKPGSEVTLSEETLAVLAPVMVPRKNPVAVLEGELIAPSVLNAPS